MEAASSIAGLISLAGLVLEGVQTLRTFCLNFKLAGNDVQETAHDLWSLANALEQLEKLPSHAGVQPSTSTLLRRTIIACKEDVDRWLQMIQNAGYHDKKGIERFWKRLSATLDCSRRGELRQKISSHRGQLSLALELLGRDTDNYQREQLAAIRTAQDDQHAKSMHYLQTSVSKIDLSQASLNNIEQRLESMQRTLTQSVAQKQRKSIRRPKSGRLFRKTQQLLPKSCSTNQSTETSSTLQSSCLGEKNLLGRSQPSHMLVRLVKTAYLVQESNGRAMIEMLATTDRDFDRADIETKIAMIKYIQGLRLLTWLLRRDNLSYNARYFANDDTASALVRAGSLNIGYKRLVVTSEFLRWNQFSLVQKRFSPLHGGAVPRDSAQIVHTYFLCNEYGQDLFRFYLSLPKSFDDLEALERFGKESNDPKWVRARRERIVLFSDYLDNGSQDLVPNFLPNTEERDSGRDTVDQRFPIKAIEKSNTFDSAIDMSADFDTDDPNQSSDSRYVSHCWKDGSVVPCYDYGSIGQHLQNHHDPMAHQVRGKAQSNERIVNQIPSLVTEARVAHPYSSAIRNADDTALSRNPHRIKNNLGLLAPNTASAVQGGATKTKTTHQSSGVTMSALGLSGGRSVNPDLSPDVQRLSPNKESTSGARNMRNIEAQRMCAKRLRKSMRNQAQLHHKSLHSSSSDGNNCLAFEYSARLSNRTTSTVRHRSFVSTDDTSHTEMSQSVQPKVVDPEPTIEDSRVPFKRKASMEFDDTPTNKFQASDVVVQARSAAQPRDQLRSAPPANVRNGSEGLNTQGEMHFLGLLGQDPNDLHQRQINLADYQMQLMLLEQQNKRRVLMARQEQDNVQSRSNVKLQVTPQPGYAVNNFVKTGKQASADESTDVFRGWQNQVTMEQRAHNGTKLFIAMQQGQRDLSRTGTISDAQLWNMALNIEAESYVRSSDLASYHATISTNESALLSLGHDGGQEQLSCSFSGFDTLWEHDYSDWNDMFSQQEGVSQPSAARVLLKALQDSDYSCNTTAPPGGFRHKRRETYREKAPERWRQATYGTGRYLQMQQPPLQTYAAHMVRDSLQNQSETAYAQTNGVMQCHSAWTVHKELRNKSDAMGMQNIQMQQSAAQRLRGSLRDGA